MQNVLHPEMKDVCNRSECGGRQQAHAYCIGTEKITDTSCSSSSKDQADTPYIPASCRDTGLVPRMAGLVPRLTEHALDLRRAFKRLRLGGRQTDC